MPPPPPGSSTVALPLGNNAVVYAEEAPAGVTLRIHADTVTEATTFKVDKDLLDRLALQVALPVCVSDTPGVPYALSITKASAMRPPGAPADVVFSGDQLRLTPLMQPHRTARTLSLRPGALSIHRMAICRSRRGKRISVGGRLLAFLPSSVYDDAAACMDNGACTPSLHPPVCPGRGTQQHATCDPSVGWVCPSTALEPPSMKPRHEWRVALAVAGFLLVLVLLALSNR